MPRDDLNHIDKALLLALEEDAKADRPARSNLAYGEAIGCNEESARYSFRRLSRRCAIAVETAPGWRNRRRIWIGRIHTGWSELTGTISHTRQAVVRPCMCCREPFPSKGKGNRLCDPCKERDGPPSFATRGTATDFARAEASASSPQPSMGKPTRAQSLAPARPQVRAGASFSPQSAVAHGADK